MIQVLLRVAPWLFVLIWSTGFTVSKIGLEFADPFVFLAVRFAIASVIMAALAIILGKQLSFDRQLIHAVVVGILIHGAYLGGVFWAIGKGMPAGVSSIIVSIHPIVSAILAASLLNEKLTLKIILGLAMGFIGVAAVVGSDLPGDAGSFPLITILASLIALLGIAVGTVFQKSAGGKIDLIVGSAIQFAAAAVVMFVVSYFVGETKIIWSSRFIFALSWLVLVLSIGAVTLLMVMISHDSVAKVSTYFYLVPAVVVIQSFFLFGETLGLLQLVGMALTMMAVAIANR